MTTHRKDDRKRLSVHLSLVLLVGLVLVVCLLFVVYRPDRPVATIVPGSSSGPAFVVQVVRPRLGLPLGGAVPPQFFGLDSQLGFDSTSDGAKMGSSGPGRIEMVGDDWDLLLVYDSDGRVTSETEVVFDLVFEDRVRRVRCRPRDPAVGKLDTVALGEAGELAGSFVIELTQCEDAETGTPLGWPPEPLILRGSFDRLPVDDDVK